MEGPKAKFLAAAKAYFSGFKDNFFGSYGCTMLSIILKIVSINLAHVLYCKPDNRINISH